jgi:hypothetical protein
MPAFRTSACGMYFVNRYRAASAALPLVGRGVAFPAVTLPLVGCARPLVAAGNVTEGNVTEGNVTEGNVTEGNVTGGNATPRPTP